ncbi:SPFH domain-containing protein [Clostridium sp. 19966]|uniref:SPFH domain-containing protein n=1 Tax=Clostridium sp. 19966 TaxID=2768166 RepID=UPI0028DE2EE7|nr:SPFH domain-containing protein [Clostridium sp. 19966]MDT8716274.1 SPFH domain-containing protein [Clostridium sp. 19966]
MAIVEVIKYNGSNDVFAWKYPNEEIGTWSQLVVNESQEAILFKGGEALDIFTSGTHTLSTQNIPILNKIINLPFGGRSPFTAEVWYINKGFSLDIKWGTATPIQLQDPKYKILIKVRAFGQFGIQIENSRKFLIKLVGTTSSFSKDTLLKYFRGLYLTKSKDAISSYLIDKQISMLEINAHLEELSDYIKEKMKPVMGEYGITLVDFYVNDINVPEDDPGVIKLRDALAKRAEMDIVGYSYNEERSFNTMDDAVKNNHGLSSDIMSAGVGFGIGQGIGANVGRMAQNITADPVKKNCPNCNAAMDAKQRFCGLCGFDTEKMHNEKVAASDKVICSECGATYSTNFKFCPECGNVYNPCPKCHADVKEGASVCHQCGASMPKNCSNCGCLIENENIKFCPECGTSLVKICSSCGVEIKGDPKFCPECGNKL